MTLALSSTLRTTRVDAIATAIGNGGKIRIYSGTRPATGGTATTLLAELTGASPFAPGGSAGVLTASAITGDTSADATGTATWFRVVTSGATFVMDGDVAASSSDLNLTSTSIVATEPVNISSFVLTEGNA
jgi:pseudouridine-5'-phosphate glycosidase